MRALEFKSTIENDKILIPNEIQSELNTNQDVRVIVLIEDVVSDDQIFQKATQAQFLEGYADSDAIYDIE